MNNQEIVFGVFCVGTVLKMEKEDLVTAEKEVIYCVRVCNIEKRLKRSCRHKQRGLSLLFMRFLHEQDGDVSWAYECGQHSRSYVL